MKAETAMGLITPGSLETAKQDWRRDPATWRAAFKAREVNLRADHDEVADALERHFDELPKWKPRADRLGRRY